MYVAKHYIGREFIPGEVLPGDIPPDVIERWLAAGAIEKVPGFEPVDPDDTGDADDGTNSGAAAPNEPPVDAVPAEDETAGEEIDEEAEPPEIDAAEGIVSEEKPKAKAVRGKGGKRK